MTTAPGQRVHREPKGDAQKLTAVTGLAALSLDALSSVAYGPEAIVLALVAAGSAATSATLPITIAIALLLLVLVLSYRQVIAVHPNGGGAYSVAKADLSRPVALLAAGSLVVDYVLTVAVSLAAGAASLASVFPALNGYLLPIALIGLLVLTAINLVGLVESAVTVMIPTIVFVLAVGAAAIIAIVAPGGSPIGDDLGAIKPTEALGFILVLKAFAAGCSALTGVEAIANGVPAFRAPAVARAKRTELSLGLLLGVLLILLAVAISVHHLVPRGGVTILAQVSAIAFGTGWLFFVTNLAVTLVLLFAANTSFASLPVLMNLLARDNRLPHLFTLRSEKPVYRVGVVVLALLAALLLVILNADTNRLLPLFAIGVFVGFTISQIGLVRHWFRTKEPGWRPRAALNAFGALLTALAAIVFLASKFVEGAWVLLLILPALILLFGGVERYYTQVGRQLGLGTRLPRPVSDADDPLVLIPVSDVSARTELALRTAMRLGGRVEAVAVAIDLSAAERLSREWEEWDCGVPLRVLPSPHRSLVTPLVGYVQSQVRSGADVTVLLAEVDPRHRWQEIFHNQRGTVLAAVLRSQTDAVIATVPFRLR